MKKLIFLAFFISLFGYSAGENKCGELEKCFSFESSVHDRDSLQRGLGIYKNYCLFVLTVGFVYEWKKGALEWD